MLLLVTYFKVTIWTSYPVYRSRWLQVETAPLTCLEMVLFILEGLRDWGSVTKKVVGTNLENIMILKKSEWSWLILLRYSRVIDTTSVLILQVEMAVVEMYIFLLWVKAKEDRCPSMWWIFCPFQYYWPRLFTSYCALEICSHFLIPVTDRNNFYILSVFN